MPSVGITFGSGHHFNAYRYAPVDAKRIDIPPAQD